MDHVFTLVVGDWSYDGHEKVQEYTVRCTHSLEDVKAAYGLACTKLGFDLMDYCKDYEEYQLPNHVSDRLVAAGIFESGGPDEDPDELVWMYPHAWADTIMAIAKLEMAEDMDYEFAEPRWHVGGYGLC